MEGTPVRSETRSLRGEHAERRAFDRHAATGPSKPRTFGSVTVGVRGTASLGSRACASSRSLDSKSATCAAPRKRGRAAPSPARRQRPAGGHGKRRASFARGTGRSEGASTSRLVAEVDRRRRNPREARANHVRVNGGFEGPGNRFPEGDVGRRSAAAKQRAGAGSREGPSQEGSRVEGHRSRERASGRGSRTPFTRWSVDAISVAVGAAPSVVVAVATGAREAVHANVRRKGEEPSPEARESPKRESRREARHASQGRRKSSRAVAARERGCSQST